jgi:hypothetical protein
VRRQTRMTETFESSVSEDNALKFHMDKTLYKGIKYRVCHLGTTTSARFSM